MVILRGGGFFIVLGRDELHAVDSILPLTERGRELLS